jgi:hypothetical protein
VDQLSTYEATAGPIYYAMRFCDGLKDDIKSLVMIHRPSSLDYACSLTLVQEAAVDSGKKEYRRHDQSFGRLSHKPATFLTTAPKYDKPRVSKDKAVSDSASTSSVDEKFRALKQYRRARGICDRCAEKWTCGHKCATIVQLHAIQELWELLPDEQSKECPTEELDSVASDG